MKKGGLKGELHSNSWNLTFINKLQFPLILRSLVFKASFHTETCFYTFSE